MNAVGQGGQNLTTAIDRQVQPGGIYRYAVYAVLPTPHGLQGTGLSNVITVTIPGDDVQRAGPRLQIRAGRTAPLLIEAK